MAETKKTTNKKKGATDGITKKSGPAAAKTGSQTKEVTGDFKKKVAEPDTLKETGVTAATVDAAEQQAAVIAEERAATPVAKAGKRSAKSIAASEAKQAKTDRKLASEAGADESKTPSKPRHRTAADRLKARGKNYRKAQELIDRSRQYDLKQAMDLVRRTAAVKFDATVELHVNLSVDPKQSDQNVRGNVVLPGGTGKTMRVAVLAEGDDAAKAKKAGADIAAGDDLLAELEKETINFDTLIATPVMMPKLGKYARLLGPRGLMPNPKSGTVTTNVIKAVEEAKSGRVEFRVDSSGIIHVGFGKASFDADKLTENYRAVMGAIKAAKPASIKGSYIKSIFVTTSMGPSIALAVTEA